MSDVRDVVVDDEGVRLHADSDRAVDVRFDGERVWSFWSHRDTEPAGGGQRLASWPAPLKRYLNGSTRLTLVDHVTETELYADEVSLGTGEGRIAVVDGQGRPLGLDKSNRLSRLFGSRTAEHTKPLLDSMAAVVDALAAGGVDAFLAYGTLLGAVRQGGLIGHDSDVDLGYVSRHTNPVDAIGESFRLQRALVDMGFPISRYSGLAFKVVVRESDGTDRGLDVFGGLMVGDHLYLMGEVGHPFREEWIWPTSQVEFEGRSFPAPAQPEHLLEAMYGPSWRVPDPAYQFSTPPATIRRLNGWFRGSRVARDKVWGRFYSQAPKGPLKIEGTAFMRWVRDREAAEPEATYVDVGCGRGGDVLWLADQGIEAVGLDYVEHAPARAAKAAEKRGLPATYAWANLCELRSVVATGAQLGHRPGRRVVTARHVADATDLAGRRNLLRLGRMLTQDGGRLYLQVLTARGKPRPHGVTPLDADVLVREIVASGGRVEERQDFGEDPDRPNVCRLVITWDR